MNRMKIAAYAIAKNEERNVEHFLRAIRDFDEVVVVDTGSADKTARMLREAGINVVEKAFDPFDFSEARNFSLSCVSPTVDWCFSLDFNEHIDEDWREKFEAVLRKEPQATMIEVMRYDDLDGEVGRGSEDKRILHRRDRYEWKNAVHEVLVPRESIGEIVMRSDISITKKIQRSSAKEDLYAAICLREYRKDPAQSFYIWFLIGYYYDRQDWQRTIEYGSAYLDATCSVKSDFRVHAYLRINRALYELGDREGSFRYGMLGFSEALFFPGNEVFGQAAEHMLRYAVLTDNTALTAFIRSFQA